MKKYLSVLLALLLVLLLAFGAVYFKQERQTEVQESTLNIGTFTKQNRCARHPSFLQKLKIPQPIAIDLSQQNHKGLAFLYGQGLKEALHLKSWEKFDHFSTYALDPKGNTYLSPMPFISIKKNTFAFQKNIYKLDTNSGNLSVWMTLDEVKSGKNNPYGVISLIYDCDDHTLWVSAIDESHYAQQKGVIYQIDIQSKKILQRLEGIDALSLQLVKTNYGKYLLYGSARENGLFALKLESNVMAKPTKLFELPVANEYIRKIRIRDNNRLNLQTIPFSYSLVAETSSKVRNSHTVFWDTKNKVWRFK
jgi:hypothetical protein